MVLSGFIEIHILPLMRPWAPVKSLGQRNFSVKGMGGDFTNPEALG